MMARYLKNFLLSLLLKVHMDSTLATHIKNVIRKEAEGLLSDVLSVPELICLCLQNAKNKNNAVSNRNNAISYIEDILSEEYNHGSLKIALYPHESKIIAYAMIILCSENQYYLHKIYVDSEYRRRGLGSRMLNEILDTFNPMCLLSAVGNDVFFEKNGFSIVGTFLSKDVPGCKLSSSPYDGLSIMSTAKDSKSCGFFLLGDTDLKEIEKLLLSS
ncbi:MAG: N-acetyltransferase [Candidatus Electrothrix sp. AU1_5]|nr:N-acetyltransferase [Candidatus Electrothrix gigas]